MVRAVLDANVYVSAAVRVEGPPGRIVERFLRDATFELVVSQAIAAEVLRAFTYPKVRKYIRAGLDPELWFEDIVVLAQWVSGEYELAGVCKDPWMTTNTIAAAVEGRAAFVVAGDPDLLGVKEYEGIRVISPRGFLNLLGNLMIHDRRRLFPRVFGLPPCISEDSALSAVNVCVSAPATAAWPAGAGSPGTATPASPAARTRRTTPCASARRVPLRAR